MHLHGIIRTAVLEETPPDSGNLEVVLKIQGVGPGQPRTIVIPHAVLIQDDRLDPDELERRAFEAEVAQDQEGRWLVARIDLASKVLRAPE